MITVDKFYNTESRVFTTLQPLDLFNLGNGTETLHWAATASGIPLGDALSGFGYNAIYSAAEAPYMVITGGFPSFGDPPIPGSPDAIASGLLPVESPTAVPEPSTFFLFGAGFIGAGQLRKRIQRL